MHIQFVFVNIVLLYFPFASYTPCDQPVLRFSATLRIFKRFNFPHRQNRPISFLFDFLDAPILFSFAILRHCSRERLSHHPNLILSFSFTISTSVYHSYAFTLFLCEVRTDVQCTFSQNTKKKKKNFDITTRTIVVSQSLFLWLN